MLGCVGRMPKRKIGDLVDELLKEIEEKDTSERLSAATALRKEVMSLSFILDAWRIWVSDVVLLDLLPAEDLQKMVRDFAKVLTIIAPPSAHFSDIVEEFDKKNFCEHQEENSSQEGIKVV